MLVQQNIKAIPKKVWRLVEVYLFLLVSVFGGQGIIKNNFSSKYSSRNAECRILVSNNSSRTQLFSQKKIVGEIKTKQSSTKTFQTPLLKSVDNTSDKDIHLQFIINLPTEKAYPKAFNLSQIVPPLLI